MIGGNSVKNDPIQLFRRRLVLVNLVVILGLFIIIARLVYLQVYRYDDYLQRAQSNQEMLIPIPPARGEIYDRYGEVLAHNNPGVSLDIVPTNLELRDKETREQAVARVIGELAQIVRIDESDIRKYKRMREDATAQEPIPIRSQLNEQEVAAFAAVQLQYPGVEINQAMQREYPNGDLGVHAIGYVGRINKNDKDNLKKSSREADYSGTSHIGKSGIEQSYEEYLHGKPGFERIQVTAGRKRVDEFESQKPINGKNLELTLDGHMQAEVEKAFGKRRGVLIAIEPSTGEILAFVSSPTYDPNLFIDGVPPDVWDSLNKNEDIPLLNRALRGGYPIGSTYKPFMALAALHSGVRSADKVIQDGGVYVFGNHRYRDSTGGRGHGPVNMFQSIAVSSDVYYYGLAQEMGVDLMHKELSRFGFGQKTGIDLVGELTGILPSTEWFKKKTGRDWSEGQTISLGIGQGENVFTILQLAYATSLIANNGVGMKPHLVKSIMDPVSGEKTVIEPTIAADLHIPAADIEVVRRGMIQVNVSGTGRGQFNGLGYVVAGKTGTAQVFSVGQNSTYAASRKNARMIDHSLYIAFAPADKPRIAIAAIVENGGFGAKAAAPVVRRALEAFNESNAGTRLKVPDVREKTPKPESKNQP